MVKNVDKKKLLIIILSGVLALAVIIASVILIVKNNKDSDFDLGDEKNDPTYVIHGDDNEIEDNWEVSDWE